MMFSKCDLCKEVIKNEPIMAGIGFLSRIELCEKCGKPITTFLKKHRLIKGDQKKKAS